MLNLSISGFVTGVGIWLVSGVYKLAAFAFKIFMILAQSDVLSSVNYTNLINNFYLILGVVMLFIMAFSLLMGLVNPDDQKQGATAVKKLIINFVISCIILGFLPTIFTFLFDAQNSILKYNVIGGFFNIGVAGEEVTTSDDNVESVERSANEIVNGIYTAFFNVSEKGFEQYCSDLNGTSSDQALRLKACQEVLENDDESGNLADYISEVNINAAFGMYSDFSEQAADGFVDFNFLIQLIAGAALVYIGVSYCFDMALRLIKLVFYQLIAPIPVFLRIVPNSKLSGTFTQWLKITLTCWGEVFIRIFIFYFCVWLCSALMDTEFMTKTVYAYGWTTGLFTKAFILMAIVMFMKRSPKLLSEITGIDSGNMKLGIREKLADGGAFVAGAAIGGGATMLGRNAISSWKRTSENYKEAKKENASGWKKAGIIAKGAGAGLLSMAAGTSSGFVRSGKSAVGKKTFTDTRGAVVSGTNVATEKATKRHDYVAQHGGVVGAIKGHGKDMVYAMGGYFGVGPSEGVLSRYTTAAQTSDSINSVAEGTYKTKKEYQDQSSVVKRLAAENSETIRKLKEYSERKARGEELTPFEKTAERALRESAGYKEYLAQRKILDDLRRDLSESKTDVLATAATRIAVDQKAHYASDPDFSKAFKDALTEAFGEFTIDDKGKVIGENLSDNRKAIIEAMLKGEAVDKKLITRNELIAVQDAIDKINVGRQNLRGEQERKYIVASGNKSSGKSDSK